MKGYRSEYLFGEGITDPLQVARYETWDLGNADIPYMLLSKPELYTKEELDYLDDVFNCRVASLEDLDFWNDIVKKFIGTRTYCKWLCKTPKDVYDSYVGIFNSNKITYEEFKEEIEEYEIPENAIVLADLDREGKLYVW